MNHVGKQENSDGRMMATGMKPLPPPAVPGNTDAERFDNAVRTMFSVPKVEIERREAEWKQTQYRPPVKAARQRSVSKSGKLPRF